MSAAEGVRAGVLAGMGVTIASAWMFSPELESGEVRAVLTNWFLPLIDLFAVYPTGRLPSAKARTFAAFVEKELQVWRGGARQPAGDGKSRAPLAKLPFRTRTGQRRRQPGE
jgi:DNA-binding transcriptional LysR family regulator